MVDVFVVIQSFSHVWLFVTLWTAAHQASLSFTRSLELAQTSAHWVCNTIQPSHSLLSPFPDAFNLFQHQGLSQWVSSLYQVAKVLELRPQCGSLQWIFRIDFLWDWFVWSSYSSRDSQGSSPTTQFKSVNSSVLSLLYGSQPHIHTWLLEKP